MLLVEIHQQDCTGHTEQNTLNRQSFEINYDCWLVLFLFHMDNSLYVEMSYCKDNVSMKW